MHRNRVCKLEEVEDSTWLTGEDEFDKVFGVKQGSPPQSFLMDRFYRAMRKRSGLLMEARQAGRRKILLRPGKP